MKQKIATIVCTLFLALFPLASPKPARQFAVAETATETAAVATAAEYACIVEDEVFFLATPDSQRGLFVLPKTYFVKVLSYGTEYSKIEYLTDTDTTKRIVGYAQTDKLAFVPFTPARPYLYYDFEVHYKADDSDFTGNGFLTQISVTCGYYGDYAIGPNTYCYVYQNGEYGYVPKPQGLRFEENTEYADYLSTQTPPKDEDGTTAAPKQSGGSSPIQIAILIAVCLLIPVLAGFLIKPSKKPPYDTDE